MTLVLTCIAVILAVCGLARLSWLITDWAEDVRHAQNWISEARIRRDYQPQVFRTVIVVLLAVCWLAFKPG